MCSAVKSETGGEKYVYHVWQYKTSNPLYKLVFDVKIVGSTSYHCNSIDFMFEKSKAKEGPSDGQLVC
jgi:hypothetical protein